jgi:hypothetical protein
MALDRDALFRLLPAIHKSRDAEAGGVLEILLSVLGEQVEVLQENLDQLYDDQFIETSAPWVVPYIGDLVGARGLKSVSGTAFRTRAFVANTIAYRRRKGTAAMLEQLARDVTRYPAAVAEMFERLVTTQAMNHVRLHSLATPDLRNGRISEAIDTAFDRNAHTIDVRRISSGRGRYNIPNVAIFLWRIGAYPLTNSPAVPVDAQRFMFSPLGNNMELYTQPETEEEIAHLAEPINVPIPITIRAMAADLEAYYGADKSVHVIVDDVPVPLSDIDVCNLSDEGGGWANTPPPAGMVSIDPERGRIARSAAATDVVVSFRYGFGADVGGGEYERGESLTASPITIAVTRPDTIASALTQLGAQSGVIEIRDNGRYIEAVDVKLAPAQHIEIRGRNGARPLLNLGATMTVQGGADSELTLNGLLIEGALSVPLLVDGGDPNHLAHLRLRHCTIVPGVHLDREGNAAFPANPSIVVDADQGELHLLLDRSISGPVQMPAAAGDLTIRDSIVDSPDRTKNAIGGGGPNAGCPATIERATVFGRVHVQELTLASESIFTERIVADRRQTGCVRFSFVRRETGNVSLTPRRHHCEPETEIAAATARAIAEGQPTGGIAAAVMAWLRPAFVSSRYGDPGYALLDVRAPMQIRTGAEDGSEMGAFHIVQAARREANLRAALDEYLRFGLEAGIFYAS